MTHRPNGRVLTIDPTDRGFGYVIFEGPELIDFGERRIRGEKNAASIAVAGRLISRFRPQIMVLEDVAARSWRRRERVRELIEALDSVGRKRGLTIRRISQADVKRAFLRLGIRNKNQMAQWIAARFPELASYVPSERKPWMSEDRRMAVFDAAAFGLVSFEKTARRTDSRTQSDQQA